MMRRRKRLLRKANKYARKAWLDLVDELEYNKHNGFIVDIRVEIPDSETDCLDDAYHIGYELVDCLVEENLDYNIYLNQIRRKR